MVKEVKLGRGFDYVDVASWQITGPEEAGPGLYLTLRKCVRGKNAGVATFDLRYWGYHKDKEGNELRNEGLRCAYSKHLFDMGQAEIALEVFGLALKRAREEGLQ